MFTIAPVIETDRLCLRPGRLADKDTHVAMWADERVTRFIGGEPRAPDVSWGKFLSAAGLWPVMGFGYWVFADRASDALVGASLYNMAAMGGAVETLEWWQGGLVLLGIAIVATVLGGATTWRRDVS